jgi:NADH-quinone oxidoreductase subunit N
MGYVVIALLSGKGGGYVAAAYYAIAYGVISLVAFGSVSVIERNGVGYAMEDYRGLGYKQPYASGVLTLALFALAGIPTTIGFTGKFLIFTAAIRSGEVVLAVIGILLAAVSIYYYLRVVVTLYFTHSESHEISHPTYPEYIVLSAASAAILVLGLWPDALINRLSQLLP